MSSLAGTPEAPATRPSAVAPAYPPPPPARARSRAVAGLAVGVAVVLAATAFLSDGGLRLERTTHVEIALMLLGALLCAGALLAGRARRAPLHGGAALLAIALLAAYTAVSIVWSLAPSDSWL